jgi:hypothetical protein
MQYLMAVLAIASVSVAITSCEKDSRARTTTPTPTVTSNSSFVEEFDNVGDLSGKGWAFVNNSSPVGQSGWRQGRYESAAQQQYKFLAPVPYLGFPAYSAHHSPNDFISVDATAVNDALTGTGDINAWLIGPKVTIKNGDSLIFYTRAVDDANYGWYSHDRMQVRVNYNDGSADVGGSTTSVGQFTTLMLDINPDYLRNDPAGNGGVEGYPRIWTKKVVKFTSVPGGIVTNARFAFRYLATDAGVFGGTGAENYPSVVGIDSLAFVHIN